MTVLFSDLVGSTALATRLGDDEADRVRRSITDIEARAVERGGGQVVKRLGDGMMAVFTSAAAALDAAVELQQRTMMLASNQPTWGVQLRIGVAAGEVIEEHDGDWHGTPVVEAARLCSACSPSDVLVGDVVISLVGSRGGFTFHPAEEFDLKGLGARRASRLLIPTLVDERGPAAWPLPPELDRAVGGPFVGRDSHLELLIDELKRASAGERRTVLVRGEPGIGKTRLAAELARRAQADGVRVVFGRCDEELPGAFDPVAGVARALVNVADDELLAAHLAAHGGNLSTITPALAGRVADVPPPSRTDPQTDRLMVAEALADLVTRHAATGPLVIVLDDLHWITRAGMTMVRHLIADIAPGGVLVVITYRDTDLDRTHPFAAALADLRRLPGVSRLDVRGLHHDDVRLLLERLAGHELASGTEPLVDELVAETEGNPFFLGEVLRHLIQVGALVQHDHRWTLTRPISELGIPEGVKEVIGRRLSRLPDGADSVLATAAVIGRRFELDLLRWVHPGDDLFEALDAAVDASLIEETPTGYTFSHALVSQTLLEELTVTRRARIHHDIARALSEHCDTDAERLPELAYHWTRAARVGSVDTALDYCSRAASQAAERFQWEQAISFSQQGLDLLGPAEHPSTDAVRLKLMIAPTGSAWFATEGEIAARAKRAEILTVVERIGDQSAYVDLAVSFTMMNREGDEYLLDKALDVLSPAEDPARFFNLFGQRTFLLFNQSDLDLDQLDAFVQRLYDHHGGTPEGITVLDRARLGVLQMTAIIDPDLHRATSHDWTNYVWARSASFMPHDYVLGSIALRAGDTARARLHFSQLSEITRATGQAVWGELEDSFFGFIQDLREGRLADFAEVAADPPALYRITEAGIGTLVYLEFVFAALTRTRIDRTDAFELAGFGAFRVLTAEALCLNGALDEAQELVDGLVIGRNWVLLGIATHATNVAYFLGDQRLAAHALDRLQPFAGQFAHFAMSGWIDGAIDRMLGINEATLGNIDAAIPLLEAAIEQETALGATTLVAMSHEWLARIAFDAGRRELAHTHAMAGQALGEQIGATALAERCRRYR